MLCYRLFSKRPHEAKGVYLRHGLNVEDFKTLIPERREKLLDYGMQIDVLDYE